MTFWDKLKVRLDLMLDSTDKDSEYHHAVQVVKNGMREIEQEHVETILGTTHLQHLIIGEVLKERGSQDKKWGGAEHDDGHELFDWLHFIEKKCGQARYHHANSDFQNARRRLIQIAALAIAAVESANRRTG